MKITVVTVCYNCASEIEATIQSVINQTYKDIEYIVIDGASKDGTLEIINKYADRITKIVSEPDHGIYDAMNKAIKLATGDFINFMNAGDTFADDKAVEEFFSKAENYTTGDILYGDVIMKYPFGLYYKDCRDGKWCHQSIFASASLMKKFGFDLSFKIKADSNFVKQARNAGAELIYVPRVVAIYESYNGLSSQNGMTEFIERSKIYNYKHDFQWYKIVIIGSISIYIKKILKKRGLYKEDESVKLERLQKSIESNPNYRKL